MKIKKKELMGFKQAIEYVLDLCCFAYYVKHDTLISDTSFDELEKLYGKMFNKEHAPMRAIELTSLYSNGVQAVYDSLKRNNK